MQLLCMKYVILATKLVLWEVSKVTCLDQLGILIHLLPCPLSFWFPGFRAFSFFSSLVSYLPGD